jgi:hypothetical protein
VNLEETGQILIKIAALTKMSPPGKGDVAAWHSLPEITRMSFADAQRAVTIYYQQHKSPMAPVDLIQTVKVLPQEGAAPRGPFYGEPGEVMCVKCHGVHFPQERCGALVPMPGWFRERYAAAARTVGIPTEATEPTSEEMPF